MTSAGVWVAGARPRTLGIGAVPVLVGAAASRHPSWGTTVAALVVALGLQVGANYANDCFDGVRGVDTEARIGPPRLVAGGLASPAAVLTAAMVALGVAAATGIGLVVASGEPWLLAAGGLALLAAVLYTGGPWPYAGEGVAEIAVFAFFGLLGTCGTELVEIGRTTSAGWWASVPVGLLAAAVLMANNLRDIETDAAAGRRTLAVRLGPVPARFLFQLTLVAAPTAIALGVITGGLPPEALLALAATPLVVPPMGLAARTAGRALVPALLATARLHAVLGMLLAIGLVSAP